MPFSKAWVGAYVNPPRTGMVRLEMRCVRCGYHAVTTELRGMLAALVPPTLRYEAEATCVQCSAPCAVSAVRYDRGIEE